MKRMGIVVLTIALAGIGCVSSLPKEERPPQVRLKGDTPPPVVVADEINEKNFSEKKRAFREELENEIKERGNAE